MFRALDMAFGSGVRLWSGFRVRGLGLRFWGLGYRVRRV